MNNFKVTENSFLVTMDVKALYTKIPNNECIAAVKLHKENDSHKSDNKILSTYFDTNNFIFNSMFYFQIKGCAVTTICAPT